MKNLIIGILFLSTLALCGCQKDNDLKQSDIEINDTLYANINLKFDISDSPTKMRGVDENLLSDFNIYIFNEYGALVERFYQGVKSPINFRVGKNQRYDIYVIANGGGEILVNSKSDLLGYQFSSPSDDGVSLTDGAVVMVGKCENISITEDCTLTVGLKRRVAQIVVLADTSALFKGVNLTFESIRVVDAPSKVKLFTENKVTSTNDLISYSFDPSGLFGSGAKCYLYENMQGTLKPSNSEYSGKFLEEGDQGYGVSTYIEIKCHYKSVRYDGTIYYRYYLGEDVFSNFDVKGNVKYLIKIYFAGNASVRENSWRVESTDLVDNSFISFKNKDEYLYISLNLMVDWGIYLSDDELPTVISGDTSALKVVFVSPLGVALEAYKRADTYLEATLGSHKARCNVYIY